jgi:uncharacterized membrane protein YphA (DoxX/SURF4 family)
MDSRFTTITTVLRIAFGLMATLAGLDKFFNLLADWDSYVAPIAVQLSPLSPSVLMGIVGVVEFAVGLTILVIRPAIGAYIASAWLALVAVNLVLGGHFDIAVRDVVLSISAFALATLLEAQNARAPRAAAQVPLAA